MVSCRNVVWEELQALKIVATQGPDSGKEFKLVWMPDCLVAAARAFISAEQYKSPTSNEDDRLWLASLCLHSNCCPLTCAFLRSVGASAL